MNAAAEKKWPQANISWALVWFNITISSLCYIIVLSSIGGIPETCTPDTWRWLYEVMPKLQSAYWGWSGKRGRTWRQEIGILIIIYVGMSMDLLLPFRALLMDKTYHPVMLSHGLPCPDLLLNRILQSYYLNSTIMRDTYTLGGVYSCRLRL